MKVSSVTLEMTPEGASPVWKKFFDVHTYVSKVIWEGSSGGWTDLTVYFNDSDEPFPISSLRQDSLIRQDLIDMLGERV